DWDSFSKMNNIRIIKAGPPTAPDDVGIDETTAARNHPVGSTLKIFGDKLYPVAGIYGPESAGGVTMTLCALQEPVEAPAKSILIYGKVKNSAGQVTVAKRIDQALPGNKIQLTREVFATIENSIPGLTVFLRVLVVLAAIVSALVIMLAMHTTITE